VANIRIEQGDFAYADWQINYLTASCPSWREKAAEWYGRHF
jgi:hypothetical protein